MTKFVVNKRAPYRIQNFDEVEIFTPTIDSGKTDNRYRLLSMRLSIFAYETLANFLKWSIN